MTEFDILLQLCSAERGHDNRVACAPQSMRSHGCNVVLAGDGPSSA